MQESVFELNYSARPAQQPGKLGFGLWWVKTLLARMGGRISIDNNGGSGATFILRFPLD
jgi:signal transduction histidine kinase